VGFKVSELLVKGHSQYEIADILKISQPTISRDVQFLREQAKAELREYVEDKLPEEHQRCLRGVTEVLKMAWAIANRQGQETKVDEKTRLQALSLVNECYKFRIELLTNNSILNQALAFVERSEKLLLKRQWHQQQQQSDTSITNNITEQSKQEGFRANIKPTTNRTF
jgi:predicted transcriptional regulator